MSIKITSLLRPAVRAVFVVGALMAAGAADLKPAHAIDYPWCLSAGGHKGGFVSCGYVSFEQCRATASGENGTCHLNPRLRYVDHPRRAYGHAPAYGPAPNGPWYWD